MAIVSECTGHTCHSQHHVLWYFSRQPTTTILLKYIHINSIFKKGMFLKVKGGSSIVPFKVGEALVGSVHVARAVIECGQSTV